MTAATLRRVAAALETGTCPAPADARWLADRLRRYLTSAPAGLTMDLALDVSPAPGQRPWWETERIARRDAALRALSATFTGTVAARVALAAEALSRYASTAWLFDRRRQAMPEQYAGRREQWLWTAMQNGPVPSSTRQLRNIVEQANAA